MDGDLNKNIDESWKEAAEKEKDHLKKEAKFVPPEPDFNFFITTLAMQAALDMGQVPNPASNKKEENLPQAKFLIDTLGMLKEKTKGNLNDNESKHLESVLYELRMQYVTRAASPDNKGGTV